MKTRISERKELAERWKRIRRERERMSCEDHIKITLKKKMMECGERNKKVKKQQKRERREKSEKNK